MSVRQPSKPSPPGKECNISFTLAPRWSRQIYTDIALNNEEMEGKKGRGRDGKKEDGWIHYLVYLILSCGFRAQRG